MLSSTHNLKILLDENVNKKLFIFLIKKNIDVIIAPKAISDNDLAVLSKKEKRILVTNDHDFIEYTNAFIFSVILLKIPQGNSEKLLISFDKTISECQNFSGKLIIITETNWKEFNLGTKIEL